MNHNGIRLFVLTTVLLAISCGSNIGNHMSTFRQRLAPIIVGAELADLPAQAEGLYDSYEIIHFVDTETDILPPRTYAQFKRDGKIVFETDLNETENNKIMNIYIFDPAITYKGIGVGTPIYQILRTEAKLFMTGSYSSCFFDAFFQLDDICFLFDYFNGKSFSKTGQSRIIDLEFEGITEFPLAVPDFQHDAVISKIFLK